MNIFYSFLSLFSYLKDKKKEKIILYMLIKILRIVCLFLLLLFLISRNKIRKIIQLFHNFIWVREKKKHQKKKKNQAL